MTIYKQELYFRVILATTVVCMNKFSKVVLEYVSPWAVATLGREESTGNYLDEEVMDITMI